MFDIFCLQVKTFIDLELAYINTNHPDFIGYAEYVRHSIL